MLTIQSDIEDNTGMTETRQVSVVTSGTILALIVFILLSFC